MRSRLFKLFIVFMLVVGIFVNNKAIIKAEDQVGRVIIRDVNFCIEFVFNKNTSSFEPTDQSKLEEFRKMGFEFACSDPENQVFELRVESEKVCLRYPESCPSDFKIIESTTPLHIVTPEKYTDNHTLTFAGEKQYDGKTSSENKIDVTGIKCDADLNIEKIKIEFFPDLKGSYLRNEEDEFVDIEIGEHYISLGECGTHSLRTDDVIIMANGTKAIDISHKESSPESGSIQMYNSVFEINAVYQKPQEINYNDCEPIIELESNFTIGEKSVVTINANVPEKVANDSESSGPFFVEEEAILDTKSLSVKDSSLTINDENYKYYIGIMAEHIDVSDNSSLNIDGALVGIEYNNVNERGGDKLKSLLKEGGFGTEELTVPGFYFDGSINITSYFVGIEMRTKQKPTDVPLKFNYMSNNEISSTIRILGRDEDKEKLDADYITIKLFNLTDNSQFDLDYNEDKYLVFSSTSSERNVEPKYYQEFYIDKLDTYRAIRISSIVATNQILYINTPKKQVIYRNGITEDEEIAELDVDWNSIEGYTINVTDNYTFEKNLNTGDISPFIDCKGANLRITGENKTLAFNIIHSQDERKRGNGFVFVSVDPSYNTQFVGVSEDKKLNIVVSENGELSSDPSIASFASNAQSIRPTTTSLSASSNGKVSFNYVNLEARTYSSLFNLKSSDLSINNSSINYGYAYTTYPYTDSLSVIRAVNAEFIKSNINIVGHECLCTKDTNEKMRSVGVHSLGKISFEDCEKVNIQKFDCGIRAFSTNPEERTYAGTFLSKNSSLEINCCKCGIYTSECMIDVNKGNHLRVSVDEVFKDEEQHYLNPAIYAPSYVEYMIKASDGSKIIGETIEGKIEPIKSTTELNKYKSVEVITGDPESDKLLIVASHDFGELLLYSTDCPKEDPEEDN